MGKTIFNEKGVCVTEKQDGGGTYYEVTYKGRYVTDRYNKEAALEEAEYLLKRA